MIYQSKFKGAQIDELLEKVQKGDVSQYPIKEVLDGAELVPIFDGENKAVKIGSLLNVDDEIKEIKLYFDTNEQWLDLSIFDNLHNQLVNNNVQLFINDQFVSIDKQGSEFLLSFTLMYIMDPAVGDENIYEDNQKWKAELSYKVVINKEKSNIDDVKCKLYFNETSAYLYSLASFLISNNFNNYVPIIFDPFGQIGQCIFTSYNTTYIVEGYMIIMNEGVIFRGFNAEISFNEFIPGKVVQNTIYIDIKQNPLINQSYYSNCPVVFGDGTKYLSDDGEYKQVIQLYLTTNNDENKSTISQLSSNKDYICQLGLNQKTLIGNYYNGVITAFVENKIKQYVADQQTGEITEKVSIDIDVLAGLDARLKILESN